MSVYSDTLVLNDKYRNYIVNSFDYKYNWSEGSIRAGKSVANTLAFALYLETTPDKMHLVVASTVSAARTIVEEGDGKLGLRQYFGSRYRSGKFKDLYAGYIKTPTGTKIVIYLGGSLANAFTKFRGFSIGGVVLEEIDLLHENTIQEAKNRTLMASDPKYFISHNPTNPNNPIYRWLDDLQSRGLVNYCHSTIFDNPAISEERRQEIVSEYDPDSVQYKRYILGQRVVAENLIYNLSSDNIINELNPMDYYSYIVVADPGITTSATAFVLAAWNKKNKSLDILKSYHHRNMDSANRNNQKTAADYADDLATFVSDAHEMMSFWPQLVIEDSFNGADFYYYTIKAFRNKGIPVIVKFPIDSNGNPKKDEMTTRITFGTSLIYRKKFRIWKGCMDVIGDYKSAQYDPEKLQKGIETRLDVFDEGGHLDLLDCCEYAQTYYRSALI